MLPKLRNNGLELGILARKGDACVSFYRDFLGFDLVGELDPPGAHMFRFRCGDNIIKVVVPKVVPDAADPPGGPFTGTGIRYWTLHVDNLDEITEKVRQAGIPMPVEPVEMIPGVRVIIIEDPDGNWLELVDVMDASLL